MVTPNPLILGNPHAPCTEMSTWLARRPKVRLFVQAELDRSPAWVRLQTIQRGGKFDAH